MKSVILYFHESPLEVFMLNQKLGRVLNSPTIITLSKLFKISRCNIFYNTQGNLWDILNKEYLPEECKIIP